MEGRTAAPTVRRASRKPKDPPAARPPPAVELAIDVQASCRPTVLRLTDISLSNYESIEDLSDQRLLHEIAQVDPPLCMDRIPQTFTGADWPLSTAVRCWMCGFSHDRVPVFIPGAIRDRAEGGISIQVEGSLCSWACASLWVETQILDFDTRWRKRESLHLLHFIFTGIIVTHIAPARRVTELKEYGGSLGVEEFTRRNEPPVRFNVSLASLQVIATQMCELGKGAPRAGVGLSKNILAIDFRTKVSPVTLDDILDELFSEPAGSGRATPEAADSHVG